MGDAGQEESGRSSHRATWMAANCNALSIIATLAAELEALFTHTGAAYNSLADITEASKARLASDGWWWPLNPQWCG